MTTFLSPLSQQKALGVTIAFTKTHYAATTHPPSVLVHEKPQTTPSVHVFRLALKYGAKTLVQSPYQKFHFLQRAQTHHSTKLLPIYNCNSPQRILQQKHGKNYVEND